MIALMCLGVFLGMASFFAGITGEKAMRVTEQVVAAISPQTWVDGKLLGLTAAAFGTLLTYGAALSGSSSSSCSSAGWSSSFRGRPCA